ncbi:sulfurtransferase complex subunit TusD [Neiella marina]|uniref:Sulfurtransferase complex subunit TusD n=1 Tax=Neiella holothuriorum TaxID=2870530 RepID=A0ABS7EJM8_9GAMM|nr:sulfurtransferase complex subunit TusD [Neiella holothuriorum]MBW8192434.1 sulfurtransferase complex subunit TusD [Neiella holothuriorum]
MASFTLLIDSPPEHYNAHVNAISFAHAAIQQGHSIEQVFFFQQAVTIADLHLDWPADEWPPQERWQALANEFGIPLDICSAAAQRRGLGGAESLEEAEQVLLADGFKIGGLGMLVKASIHSDHVVQF